VVLTTSNRLRLLYNLLAFGQDQLDVAGVRHVRVDTTVGTVCSSTLLGGLVDLDVLDHQVAGIETLGISVGLGVLEQTEQELGRLNGPSCAGDTKCLSLCSTSSSASVSPHGDGLLVLNDVIEERLCPLELPSIDGLSGLSGVLEAHTQVGAARAGALRWVDLRRCVSDHGGWRWSVGLLDLSGIYLVTVIIFHATFFVFLTVYIKGGGIFFYFIDFSVQLYTCQV